MAKEKSKLLKEKEHASDEIQRDLQSENEQLVKILRQSVRAQGNLQKQSEGTAQLLLRLEEACKLVHIFQ